MKTVSLRPITGPVSFFMSATAFTQFVVLVFFAIASVNSALGQESNENSQEEKEEVEDTVNLADYLLEQGLETDYQSARIRYRDLDTHEVIDSYNMLLKLKRKRAQYIASFKHPCYQLKQGGAVPVFNSTIGQISKGDIVYVTDRFDLVSGGPGGGPAIGPSGIPTKFLQACAIDEIIELKPIKRPDEKDDE